MHFGQDWSLKRDVRVLDRRRLSEAWFKRHLIEWKIELGETEIRPLTEVDAEIQSYMTKIREHLSRKWSGNHHHDNCSQKVCNVRRHTLYHSEIELPGHEIIC